MAPKKRPTSPLEDDQKPSTQKQPEDKVAHEEEDEDDSSEEEEEEEGSSSEEEEEEEEKDQSQTASKNPPPSTPISNPKPASESESESGSESETDSQPEPTPPLNPKVVKPDASKPMKAQPKAQTQAQTYSILARSGTKRAAENENDSNRSKKKTTAVAVTTGGDSNDENENETEKDVKLTGEDSKKSTQRLFSEQDELTILKGLADFISKTKKDPLKDALAFHSFVKKSLSAEASSAQLKRKVRTLKKKFETSDSFTKPHDKKAFKLFKKVWGNTSANEAEENGKITKGAKKELVISNKKEAAKVKTVVDNSLIVSELFRFGVFAGSSVLNKDAMERLLELIEESKRVEFVEKWKQVQIAEMELLVRRSQLAKEQSNLLLQALKKSSK
ncbi:probable transcription factor At4g00390 [Trifolium pratense]|uniref:probable transcription factor At4g00390 n=1 Tax=Trifolium pratense TaxID=57577 RepID=UPI001E6934E0|nr:probable transcription factor At4g00390 [Trifolium pratense]XP_045790856.1 probable transcription factor At4g00390 [Trifolium pratense]